MLSVYPIIAVCKVAATDVCESRYSPAKALHTSVKPWWEQSPGKIILNISNTAEGLACTGGLSGLKSYFAGSNVISVVF